MHDAADGIGTIGHSTRTLVEFIALLQHHGITMLVDVRSIPRSRAVPQFNGDVLPAALDLEGIGYRHLADLGGRRHHGRNTPPSPNGYWRVAAFRNYADYAATGAFRGGLETLIGLAGEHRCAIMCAEAVWWRCHRRIIADYLLSRGIPVEHIMGMDQLTPATLTPGVQILADGTLRYSGANGAAATSQ